MYRKILVPLDGSDLAARALPYARVLAHQHGAQLLLVRAVESHLLPIRDHATAQQDDADEADAYLARCAAQLSDDGDLDIEVVVSRGTAEQGIVNQITDRGADLVVMSTHGRSGLGRFFMGSVADDVLRHSPVPVLLVPIECERVWSEATPPIPLAAEPPLTPTPAGTTPAISAAARSRPRPLHIVVPLDGSDFAAEALDAARSITRPAHPKVTLVSAVEPMPLHPFESDAALPIRDVDLDVLTLTAHLEGQANHLRAVASEVDVHVTVGPAAPAIVACAREREADLVVMATHGRGGLGRLLMGSVAAGVLQELKCPLLLVRPAGVREAAIGSMRDDADVSRLVPAGF